MYIFRIIFIGLHIAWAFSAQETEIKFPYDNET